MGRRPTLIVGEEDYLSEEALQRFIGETLTEEDRALNLDVIDGASPTGEMLTRLDTAPFFGPMRVVVIRRLEAMRESDHEALITYLERGDSPTVGIYMARELDRRRRLFATFKRVGDIIECRSLHPRDVPAWIQKRIAAAGKRAEPRVAEDLAALAGGSLRDLDQEVAKLAAYVGDEPLITRADVDAIASRLGEATIFTLADEVGHGNIAAALSALHDNLATHDPLQLLYMITRQFRLILRARSLPRMDAPALAERIGVHPYVATKIVRQAPGYRPDQFPEIFAALQTADEAIKTGSAPRLILETLVVQLCGMKRRAAVAPR